MSRIAALRAVFARCYHAMRLRVDGFLQPRRHRRALERLQSLGTPRRLLVVCHGNICRSPYLEAVLRRDMPDATISSAGFLRAERPVPENSRVVCAQRGFDLSAFRSTTLTRAIAAASDLVIVMDARQARQVVRDMAVPVARVFIAGDFDPATGERRAIRDPWNQPIEVFETSFDRLDRCAKTLVHALADGARSREVELSGRA
jgi:protein-tyrosine phosphatase